MKEGLTALTRPSFVSPCPFFWFCETWNSRYSLIGLPRLCSPSLLCITTMSIRWPAHKAVLPSKFILVSATSTLLLYWVKFGPRMIFIWFPQMLASVTHMATKCVEVLYLNFIGFCDRVWWGRGVDLCEGEVKFMTFVATFVSLRQHWEALITSVVVQPLIYPCIRIPFN